MYTIYIYATGKNCYNIITHILSTWTGVLNSLRPRSGAESTSATYQLLVFVFEWVLIQFSCVMFVCVWGSSRSHGQSEVVITVQVWMFRRILLIRLGVWVAKYVCWIFWVDWCWGVYMFFIFIIFCAGFRRRGRALPKSASFQSSQATGQRCRILICSSSADDLMLGPNSCIVYCISVCPFLFLPFYTK